MFKSNDTLKPGPTHAALELMSQELANSSGNLLPRFLSDPSPAGASHYLVQQGVSIPASCAHLGIRSEDLTLAPIYEGGQRLRFQHEDFVPLIKAVREAHGWGLAQAVRTLKTLALAQYFRVLTNTTHLHPEQLADPYDMLLEKFKSEALALGLEIVCVDFKVKE